jgi:hypothetical protein
MRDRPNLGKHAILGRRALSFIVRSFVILTMSFAAAFGFLAAMRSPGANYDPYMFAIGAAALFGAACGAIGILFSQGRRLKEEIRNLQPRFEEIAIGN